MTLAPIYKLIGLVKVKSILDRLFPFIKIGFNNSFYDQLELLGGYAGFKPNPVVLDDLRDRVIVLSRKSQEALHGDLSYHLMEGMQQGESITEMTTRLNKIFDLNRSKVEVIARNEIIISQKVGTLEAYDKAGVWGRKWITAMNNPRTCEICKKLNGQICKNGEWFEHPETGEDILYDQAHPQCRCTTVAVLDKPED